MSQKTKISDLKIEKYLKGANSLNHLVNLPLLHLNHQKMAEVISD